jgi:hypothetical protein
MSDLQRLGLSLIGVVITVAASGVLIGSIGARLTRRRHRD